MDDLLLIDAAERYVNGDMSVEERTYFEEIRKNNPEIDQLVVEHVFFFHQLHDYSSNMQFKHSLQETVTKLTDEGFLSKPPLRGKAKVISLWNRSKRTIAVAASIAGIVSIFIASLISTVNNNKSGNINIKPLVEKIKAQDDRYRRLEKKVGELSTTSSAALIVEKPRVESKFRATGFIIDAVNNFLVTNAHVIQEAKHQLIVENIKGEQFIAEPVYVDATNDLAILKVTDKDFKKLPATPYSIRRTNAELGEHIFMLGYPKQEIVYGEGYISAKNGYEMDSIYCQVSTSANEGNSGSPVINTNGELVGIITSTETNAEGVVFAIKSSNIYKAVEEVRKMNSYEKIKISSTNSLKGADRVGQIKRVQDYVFMIKGN